MDSTKHNSPKTRRSKKLIKSQSYSYSDKDSDNEDNPQPFESSGEEWSEEEQTIQKKRGPRKAAAQASKKLKQNNRSSSSSSVSDEDNAKPVKTKHKNGNIGKIKEDDSESDEHLRVKRIYVPRTFGCATYATGSFLILKKDAQVGDPNKHPCIWRIDGKALLQKYEPFEDTDGKIRHKTTSVYTGWSALDKDMYTPLKVKVCEQTNQTLTVELNWEKLKEIVLESD